MEQHVAPDSPPSEDVLSQTPLTPPTRTASEDVADDEKVKPAVEHDSEEAKKIRQLSDFVHTCRVCYQDFTVGRNRPRLLGCGHSFCTRCILKCSSQKASGENVIKCPECRKNFAQPPASLPVNIQLMQILTVLSLVKLKVAPEEEEDLPSIHFGSLSSLLPENKLEQLSMEDLHEHLKVVFHAVRLKANAEKPAQNKSADQEIMKIADLEDRTEKFMSGWVRIKKGEDPIRYMSPRHPAVRWGARYPFLDLDMDWMREMVVYRPPTEHHQPQPEVVAHPPVHPPPTVQAVIEQEQMAQADADPARHLANYRQAHFRRERENARMRNHLDFPDDFFAPPRIDEQARREMELSRQLEIQLAQERIQARELADRDREDQERLEQQQEEGQEAESGRAENGETEYGTIDIHDDSISVASDDSSIIEEELRPRQRRLMTRGEAVTMMRLVNLLSPSGVRNTTVNRRFPFGLRTIEEVENHVMPRDSDRTDSLEPEEIMEIRRYYLANELDLESILRIIRTHTQTYAPTLIDSPRLTRRIRRQRPVPVDDFNALLSDIRRRVKAALRGSRPTQPANDMETLMTMRLLVNVATEMGVCDKLEAFLHPDHQNQNNNNNGSSSDDAREVENPMDYFIIEENLSNRRQQAFCTVCRCSVPIESRSQHAEGRKHIMKIARRQETTRAHPSTSAE